MCGCGCVCVGQLQKTHVLGHSNKSPVVIIRKQPLERGKDNVILENAL